MKFIRQGLQFSWFFERTTKSGKISLGTKLRLRSNFANATPSCDPLLIYIVSLNNVKHYFF
jgi:hypothetical protein